MENFQNSKMRMSHIYRPLLIKIVSEFGEEKARIVDFGV